MGYCGSNKNNYNIEIYNRYYKIKSGDFIKIK